MSQLLPRDIHDWRDSLVDQGVSRSTANRYLASVSRVFNHAVDERVINTAPRIKFYPTEPGRVRYFSDLEIEQMIESSTNVVTHVDERHDRACTQDRDAYAAKSLH